MGTAGSDRRAFLERSLADLEEEHDAGDLAEDDYTRLKADYERRLAVLDGRARPRPAPPASPRPVWQRATVVGGVVAFAVLAGVLLAGAVGRRSADGTITGADVGGTESTAPATPELPDALGRCLDLSGSDAFDCYISYTRANPGDADGFLYFGVYAVSQGVASGSDELLSGGETFLRRALEIDPGKVEARVNLAVLLERTGRGEEARAELDLLDGVELPADLQRLVEFVEANLAGDGGGGGDG
jgi:hypothetical protein